jgi:LacI family transcriptional regulator
LQIAQTIEAQIQAGTWKDNRLPSLRELSRQHGVSVITMSRAVQVLRDRGYVQRTDHSGCYLARTPPLSTYALVLRITPGTWQRQSGAILLSGFEKMHETGEAQFVFTHSLDADPVAQARQYKETTQGVIFQPSRLSNETALEDERFLAACDAEGLPVVLLERNLRGRYRQRTRDLVAVDDFHGGVACTRHLIEMGRRAIGLVIASPTSSHEGREAGYLHALRNAGITDLAGPTVLQLPANVAGKEADRWLATQVQSHQLDAVFCFQDPVAVGLIVELLSRGVAVPRQVAVCGFEDLPIGDLFTLGVTTYRYPSLELSRTCVHMLKLRCENPSLPPLSLTIQGELVVRESTGPHPG